MILVIVQTPSILRGCWRVIFILGGDVFQRKLFEPLTVGVPDLIVVFDEDFSVLF